MSRILLSKNETTGAETWCEFADENARATTSQDVTELLEYAAEERALTAGEKYGDMRKMAVMPMAVVGQAMREGWLFDKARVRQWVEENKKFKTFDRNF
jgi:hypothetical protein